MCALVVKNKWVIEETVVNECESVFVITHFKRNCEINGNGYASVFLYL